MRMPFFGGWGWILFHIIAKCLVECVPAHQTFGFMNSRLRLYLNFLKMWDSEQNMI